MTDDVYRGREALNFSLWPRLDEAEEAEVEDVFEVVLDEEMPPWSYALLHPAARLSDSERQELVQGLRRTFARAGLATGEEEGEQKQVEENREEG